MRFFTIENELISWVLTYALHSSVLLGSAWLFTRCLRRGRERLQEIVWKTALIGGLLTASLQVALDFEPLGGRITVEPSRLEARFSAESPAELPPTRVAPRETSERSPLPERRRELQNGVPIVRQLEAEPRPSATEPIPIAARARPTTRPATQRPTPKRTEPALARATTPSIALADSMEPATSVPPSAPWTGWSDVLLGLWLIGGFLGAVLLALALRSLANLLAGRRILREGPVYELFVELCARGGLLRVPILCVSKRAHSPATAGVFRPRVCVPERALVELAHEHMEAMLAHELAHVARRDPQWAFVARLLERVLFFQPLNRLARRRMSVLSEFLADRWAVERTGRGLSLARCLAEVAGWIVERRTPVGVLPMATRGSLLGDRIRRLLDDEEHEPTPRERDARPVRVARIVPLFILCGVSFVLPGAAAREVDAPIESELEPVVNEPVQAVVKDLMVPEDELEPEEPEVRPSMDVLLQLLDEEFARALDEVERLDASLVETGATHEFEEPVTLLRRRIARLREAKQRLDVLVPAVMAALAEEPRPGE